MDYDNFRLFDHLAELVCCIDECKYNPRERELFPFYYLEAIQIIDRVESKGYSSSKLRLYLNQINEYFKINDVLMKTIDDTHNEIAQIMGEESKYLYGE
ncbi:hypothetical protein LG204_09440 [Methylovorus menthalis]|uniref:hypothetical protein n=1 Tax=Methylovorus menthalis TaxID=1002227 RepID=UPI001E577D0A|nr:hypothetical protein [Methylovorus menthalis]MCB4811538.1 hypothetical protein [Methylovorus menthalis]